MRVTILNFKIKKKKGDMKKKGNLGMGQASLTRFINK